MDKIVKFTLSAVNKTQSAFAAISKDFTSLNDKVGSVNQVLGGLGVGISVAGFAALTKSIIDAGDEMNDLSQRVGINVRELAKYKLATDQSGTSMEALAKGIKGMASNLVDHGAALKAVGLNAGTADEAILQLSDLFAAMPDGIEKTELAAKMFGKAGMGLIPMLNLGSQGLKDAAEKSAKYAEQMVVLAPLADQFNDNMAEVAMSSKVLGMSLANEALPGLINISKAMADAAQKGGALNIIMAGVSAGIDNYWANVNKFYGKKDQSSNTREVSGLITSGDMSVNDRSAARVKRQQGTSTTQKPQWQVDYEKYMSALGDNKDQKAGAAKAAQEAAARLTAQISAIKKAGEIEVGVISNKEKLIDALRSAGLIDERTYYANKSELLAQSSGAQEQALQKEIARLQAEKLTGKEKIENDKKIADAQADLIKLRQASATSAGVLSIQESAALKAISQSYRDAEDAAKSYLDTLRLAQSRDLSGMGQGDRERNRISGRAQIEDKYTQQRQDLDKSRRDAELAGTFGPDAQAKYDDELDRIKRFSATALTEYDAYFAKRTEQESNWAIGANEALSNYLAEAQNVASQTQEAFTSAFKGMEDAGVSFLTTGKINFKNLETSVIESINRIIVKQLEANATVALMGNSSGMGIIGSLIGAVSGTAGQASAASAMSGDSLDNMLKLTSNFAGRAGGGSVSAGSMYRVNEKGPELLQVAGKQYLMMGPQGGSVTPNDQISGGGNVVNLTLHQNFPAGTSRATTTQAAAEASRQLSYAGRNL